MAESVVLVDATTSQRPRILLLETSTQTARLHHHLKSSFLEISGQFDNVVDSTHYGPLTKTISTPSASFAGFRALVHEVTQKGHRQFAAGCKVLANSLEVEAPSGIDIL
ncbi:hypothetical protein BDR03DRAFT_979750 [Suillus americanus]|nr:hypothetical protein BDR03DRAFT_979750 [Suillus americanus]